MTPPTLPNPNAIEGEVMPASTPFEQLSEAARNYLPDLLRGCLKEDEWARRDEVRRVWEMRLYCKGQQQVFYDDKQYVFYPLTAENVSFDLPTHRGVFDITSPHKRSFVSILSENPPGINFVPDDLTQGKDISAASAAEKQRNVVDRMVQMKDRQSKVAGLLCTDGRVVAWTHIAGDKLKVDLYGVLETKVPVYSEGIADWDYCVLSRETNLWKAKAENPEFEDEIAATDSSNTSNSYYERYARLSVTARKGNFADSFKNLVTEHWCFVRPWRYLKAPDEIEAEYTKFFPDGMLMHAYGSTVVDCTPSDMGSLALEFPVDGEGQMRPCLLNGMTYIQKAYNDFRNQQRDAADYSVPRTWVHSDAIDPEAIEEQETAYGVVHVMKPPTGMSITDCFGVEPQVQAPAAWDAMLLALKADGENLTGDFPSLYGGDTPGQDTVGVNRLLNNQAKGQLGPAWACVQRLFAKVYQVAIPLSAQLTQGDSVAIKGQNGQESYSPQAILEGAFYCHPDQDSSFPQTTADKRASFAQLSQDIASMGDAGALILGQPANLKLRVQFAGIPEFFIPGAEAQDKALRQIEQCLMESPVPDQANMGAWQQAAQQAVMTGQQPPPPPMLCSVNIDPDWDYLQPMVDRVQQWLSSSSASDAERQGNVMGLQNVKLFGKSLKDALAQQQAQNKPQGPPMGIAAAFKDLDPATKVQALTRDGYQPDQDYYNGTAMQAAQGAAADTQETAANAIHKSVLAANEAVTHSKVPPPRPTVIPKQTAPGQGGGLK